MSCGKVTGVVALVSSNASKQLSNQEVGRSCSSARYFLFVTSCLLWIKGLLRFKQPSRSSFCKVHESYLLLATGADDKVVLALNKGVHETLVFVIHSLAGTTASTLCLFLFRHLAFRLLQSRMDKAFMLETGRCCS